MPVDQSSTPGIFHRVSPVPLPAIFCTAAISLSLSASTKRENSAASW